MEPLCDASLYAECKFCGQLFETISHLYVHLKDELFEAAHALRIRKQRSVQFVPITQHPPNSTGSNYVQEKQQFESNSTQLLYTDFHHTPVSSMSSIPASSEENGLMRMQNDHFSSPIIPNTRGVDLNHFVHRSCTLQHETATEATRLENPSPEGLKPEPKRPIQTLSVVCHVCRKECQSSPYPCTYCNKPFQYFSMLEHHMRTHTSEKPFECPAPGCPHRTSLKSNIQMHVKSVHTEKREHACPYCSASFRLVGRLDFHLALHQTAGHFPVDSTNNSDSQTTCQLNFGATQSPVKAGKIAKNYNTKLHQPKIHPALNPITVKHNYSGLFHCDFPKCKKVRSTAFTLYIHKLTHAVVNTRKNTETTKIS